MWERAAARQPPPEPSSVVWFVRADGTTAEVVLDTGAFSDGEVALLEDRVRRAVQLARPDRESEATGDVRDQRRLAAGQKSPQPLARGRLAHAGRRRGVAAPWSAA